MGGFIVIHREMFDHPLYRSLSAGQRLVMIHCIEMANWRPGRFWSRSQRREITVPRGSFVASQLRIADRAGVTRKIVRGALSQLEAAGFIARSTVGHEGGHRLTLITISNYSKYQNPPTHEGHSWATAGPEQGTSEGPSRVRGRALIEQGEQSEQGEPVVSSTAELPGLQPDSPMADAVETADLLRQLSLDSGQPCPGYKTVAGYRSRRPEWAKVLKRAAVDLELTQQQIRELITWAFETSPKMAFRDGRVTTWAEVLVTGDPARKVASKLANIIKHRARVADEPKKEREGYSAGPHWPGPPSGWEVDA